MTTEPMTEYDNVDNEIIRWACHYLQSNGYTLKNKLPENVKSTPWSYVVRFSTSAGYIYLKHMPTLLALEASITQILYDQFHASVPEVIVQNSELNCFLMKDAGRPLREILKKQFDTALFCKAIDQFTSMQLAVADHVNIFLDIGVPDWRLDQMPDLYKQLFLQKDLLLADGVSEIEISELETLLPMVSYLCKKLSGYAIKQTIVQSDFHDNNILIEKFSQAITIIDLGEIVISHPFFSLIGCLQQAKHHYALMDDDAAYLRLRDACFKNYMDFKSKNELLDAFSSAHILWLVYGILCQHRLMNACGKENVMSFQHGKLSRSLREFMMACV